MLASALFYYFFFGDFLEIWLKYSGNMLEIWQNFNGILTEAECRWFDP